MSFANSVLNVKAMNNFLINNVPLFNAKNHSKNETFYLASILQGLGDTVNFLGVYNYVRSFFPNVRFVFYADIVWRDILDSKRLPGVEIVFFKLASRFGQENNNLSEKDGENGLEKSFADIRKRMQKEKVFLLSSLSIGRTPESFSAKESLVQTNYRLIGYPREIREIRPYFPILKEDIDAAESFLLSNGIKDENFIVIAPQVDPVRSWGKEKIDFYIKSLSNSGKYKIVIAGLPTLEKVSINNVVYSCGISLPTLAAIISKSKLFIGHDSGLTHVAACFDIPIIGVYAKWNKQFPFETRPHSPNALIVIERFPGLLASEIQVETLTTLTEHVLRSGKVNIPQCPLCKRYMDYVVEANYNGINHLCVCGSQVLLYEKKRSHFMSIPLSRNEEIKLEGKIFFTESFFHELTTVLSRQLPLRVLFQLDAYPFLNFKTSSDPYWHDNSFLPSIEGSIIFFKKNGYFIKKIDCDYREGKSVRIQFLFSRVLLGIHSKEKIKLPWNKNKLFLRYDFLVRFFLWMSWANDDVNLEELIRRAVFWKRYQEAISLSLIIWQYKKIPRIITRMISILFLMLRVFIVKKYRFYINRY